MRQQPQRNSRKIKKNSPYGRRSDNVPPRRLRAGEYKIPPPRQRSGARSSGLAWHHLAQVHRKNSEAESANQK